MKATITKHKARFYFRCEYRHEVVQFCQLWEKRMFHRDTNEWSFPLQVLDKFSSDFKTKFATIILETVSKKSKIVHYRSKEKFDLILHDFLEDWNTLKDIAGYEYNRETKIVTYPYAELDNLREALMKKNIEFEENLDEKDFI